MLWAALILYIGEWFDTNVNLKNTYSMRDETLRKELEWMESWSFNGRIKRLINKKYEGTPEASYIHYNDNRLYESHQMALRNFHSYESKVIRELSQCNEKVYKAELDIEEFFPTLKTVHIRKMFKSRLQHLSKINGFEQTYFNPDYIYKVIDILLDFEIAYPDTLEESDPIVEVLEEYYKIIIGSDNLEENIHSSKEIMSNLESFLKDKLPLDLIASNFLSNCVLNHFVDTKLKTNPKSNISILRYTDDYTVISTDKREIKEVIDQIKEELKAIDLRYSRMKTLPTTIEDIEEKLAIIKETNNWDETYYQEIVKWFNFKKLKERYSSIRKLSRTQKKELETKSLMVGIEIKPKDISSINIEQELVISRLSAGADIKVQALSDKELEIYIQELMIYLKGKVGELKEETTKIFAAWRLNASHKEHIYRGSYSLESIKEFLNILEETIREYPYKLGFYDVYILHLLRLIENNEAGFQELERFLINIKSLMKESYLQTLNAKEGDWNSRKFISTCFPTVRIRILNLLSKNWWRFNKEKRRELRAILEKVFLYWYAEPDIRWNELYEMYVNFFILRMRLPLHIDKEHKRVPVFLDDLSRVYNKYFFITGENKAVKKGELNNEKISKIAMIAIELLQKGLYWDKGQRQFVFDQIDELIYQNLSAELIEKRNEVESYCKLEFANLAPEKLEKDDWIALIEGWSEFDELSISGDSSKEKRTNKELIFKGLEFIQQSVKRFFEEPKKYSGLLEWVECNSNDDLFKNYVKKRFLSYKMIRSYFSLTDEQLTPLLKSDNDIKIPIADWVFYCQTLPYHLEMNSKKQRVLHPLTEYEFVKLLCEIISIKCKNEDEGTKQKDTDFNIPDVKLIERNFAELNSKLFRVSMSPEKWEDFRLKKNDTDCVFEIEKKDTKKYVKILFSLLTNRPWHTHVMEHFSMYKWNDLQSYFEMTYYPSTAIASLFVNHLNIHQDFYYRHYNMPLEELPYRDVYTNEEANDLMLWLKRYFKRQKNNQVYKSDNRKLELLEIDIDKLRG